MASRTATCACGQLSLTAEGDPIGTLTCHCYECQKRTGSSHQVSAWFSDQQIGAVKGRSKAFVRTGDLGIATEFSFCPECGTTLYWVTPSTPGIRAVAVGCFADPSFPAPVAEGYVTRRHQWMPPVAGAKQFDTIPGAFAAAASSETPGES
jgi:hypothetical protein